MNSSIITTTVVAPDEHSPEQPASGPLPKWLQRIDQTEKVTFVIDAWLALDPEAQNEFLAQLIAATMHAGPDTALGIFAATGRLYAAEALDELNDVRVPLDREGWVDSLGRYILSQGGRS